MEDNPLGAVQGAPPQEVPNLSSPGMAPQMATAQQQQQPPAPDPAVADVAHHSMLGKAFRSIMGSDVSYQVDPQTGKMVQQSVEQKPGQLWRSILAGVITGGATAAEHKANGLAQGIAEGAAGSMKQRQQQDEQRKLDAQKQFEDQLKADQNKRANRAADTEETLKKAQISLHNAQTLRENKLSQMEDYTFHRTVADSGKKQIQPFIDADPTLVKFKDIPETEMNKLIKENPDSMHLLWEPTGTKASVDANGTPQIELTYTAVDPKGKVKVTQTQIDHWKEAGMDQLYGSQWDVIKNGKELSADQYMAINQKAQELTNQKLDDKKRKSSDEAQAAEIALKKAQAAHYYAEAKELKRAGGEKAVKEKTFIDASDALEKAEKEGKGFDDLPVKYQDALDEHDQAKVKDKIELLRAMDAEGKGGSQEAGELAQEIHDLTRTRVQRGQKKAAQAGPPSDAVKNVGELMQQENVPQNSTKAYDYIDSKPGMSPAEKAAAIKQYGIVPWKVITARAEQQGITRNKMASMLKAQGFRLEFESDADYQQSIDESTQANSAPM